MGRETLLVVRDGLGDREGGPGLVEGPYQRSGTGGEVLRKIQNR